MVLENKIAIMLPIHKYNNSKLIKIVLLLNFL